MLAVENGRLCTELGLWDVGLVGGVILDVRATCGWVWLSFTSWLILRLSRGMEPWSNISDPVGKFGSFGKNDVFMMRHLGQTHRMSPVHTGGVDIITLPNKGRVGGAEVEVGIEAADTGGRWSLAWELFCKCWFVFISDICQHYKNTIK